jgi:hypothetical protein
MKIITITYKAFCRDDVPTRQATSKTVHYHTALSDLAICEKAFRETNTYSGYLWDALQPLPENRTHTSLSVGDEVDVDGNTYRCADIGWQLVSTYCDCCDGYLTDWNLAPIGANEDNTQRIYEEDTYLCDECYDEWCTKYDIQPLEGE